MSRQASLTTLLTTPRMQWYLRHGAQARQAARFCQDAGWYLFGALTFRQGLSGRREERDDALRYTVKLLFDPDPMRPALMELLTQAENTPDQHDPDDEQITAIQTLLHLARQVVAAIDAIPGGISRYVQDVQQASALLHTCWAFSKAVEHVCTSCEAELVAQLTVR